jgi:hypothetical protein
MMEAPEKFDADFRTKVSEAYTGQLVIKQYATRSMTGTMLRAYLDLMESNGHKTDLLVVDYGNIMKSESRSDQEHIGVGSCFEALRAIAVDYQIGVITAARLNREAFESNNVGMEHIAGSMEIAAVADYIIANMQTPDEKKQKKMRMKILANRNDVADVVLGIDLDPETMYMTSTGLVLDADEDDGDTKDYNKSNYGKGDKKDFGPSWKKDREPEPVKNEVVTGNVSKLKSILAASAVKK